ncbi:MAG: N-succinylarginine dihydrolase [Deltaproteobacteria bacterium]|nr:N-succinylarginine dihydrolase [Deltaproteobacteria bacterium]
MRAREINFDGLVGPSHHYGGLSFGNIASATHEGSWSNPREAALQGLAKARALHRLGVGQAFFPPHMRPELQLARRLGFSGTDADVLASVGRDAPLLLAACYSASSMWTANAATVSPSADSLDGKVHFTPANLQNKIHRSIEAPTTARILRAVFAHADFFVHHDPLPSSAALGDEGAANHTRFAPSHDAPGVQLFVWGETATNPWNPRPKTFPARQTLESTEALRRLHQVPLSRAVFAQQRPETIDQGVFHNDVISVGYRDIFFVHEAAFVETEKVIAALVDQYRQTTGAELRVIRVREDELSVPTAVSTYLFNSQLVEDANGRVVLVAPIECSENAEVSALIERLIDSDAPIDAVQYFDLRQSMHGGGGPACLRLRVVLTDDEFAAVNPGVLFSDALDRALTAWIERHYRDRLRPADLLDPSLMHESRSALDELTQILKLGSIYPFQLVG